MADDLYDVLAGLFALGLIVMGVVQLRKPLASESPFHGESVPNTRPGFVRVMGWLLVFGGLLFLGLFVAGVSNTVHLAH